MGHHDPSLRKSRAGRIRIFGARVKKTAGQDLGQLEPEPYLIPTIGQLFGNQLKFAMVPHTALTRLRLSKQKMSNEDPLRNERYERVKERRDPFSILFSLLFSVLISIDSLSVWLHMHLHARDIVCHTSGSFTCRERDRLDTFAGRMLILCLDFRTFEIY